MYDVYAGGIHGVEARLDLDLSQDGRYAISLFAKTRGFLGSLAPWHGTFSSNGWRVSETDYRTDNHRSETTWRDEPEIKDYQYNKDKSFKALTIDEHDKPPAVRDVPAELTQDTKDVLTATLLVMQNLPQTGVCESTSDIFDGKRRFEMAFVGQGDAVLKPSKYNVYEGAAIECVVEVKPKGGKWHKKPRGWMSIQEQGRERGTMPTIWFAQISEDGPAYPVKIRVKTAYGTLFMHLSEYKKDGVHLIAEKREITPTLSFRPSDNEWRNLQRSFDCARDDISICTCQCFKIPAQILNEQKSNRHHHPRRGDGHADEIRPAESAA